MIKKQYDRTKPSYFRNFINSNDPEDGIEERLKEYNATLGKSKNKNWKLNVKWYDPKLYTIFVMRWS